MLDFQDFMTRGIRLSELRRYLVVSLASSGIYGVSDAASRGIGWAEWQPSHRDVAEIRLDDGNSYLDYDLGEDGDDADYDDAEYDDVEYDVAWTPYEEVLRILIEYGEDASIRYI